MNTEGNRCLEKIKYFTSGYLTRSKTHKAHMNHAIMYPDHLHLNQVQNLLKLKFPVPYLKHTKVKSLRMWISEILCILKLKTNAFLYPVKETISLNDYKEYVNILQIEIVINVGINQLKIAYICSLSLLLCIMLRNIK